MESTTTLPPDNSKSSKEHNRTGHAGLVGFLAFILITAALLSPFVPGKILKDFPLSSQDFSTGDQSLDCVGSQGKISSSTVYNRKAGAPIVYTYATSVTQSATCNGSPQTAVTGHTSQLNPLGFIIDLFTGIVAAVAISRIWRLFFGEKQRPGYS